MTEKNKGKVGPEIIINTADKDGVK